MGNGQPFYFEIIDNTVIFCAVKVHSSIFFSIIFMKSEVKIMVRAYSKQK